MYASPLEDHKKDLWTELTTINKCNLLDMGISGFSYSLRGSVTHGGMQIYEKLDRIICNYIWRTLYPEAYVIILHGLYFSDHHPIFLTLVDKDPRQVTKSFKFECA